MRKDYGLEGETLKDFMALAREFHFSTNRKIQEARHIKTGRSTVGGLRQILELKRQERKREARKFNIKNKPKLPPFLHNYVYHVSLRADRLSDEIGKLKGFENHLQTEEKIYFVQHFTALRNQIDMALMSLGVNDLSPEVTFAKPIMREVKLLSCGLDPQL